MSNSASRLVVAAAVVDRLERPTALLCAARSYPAQCAGRYELPGGKVEPGETPLAALARELVEEIDLTVRIGREVHPPPELSVPAPGGACGPGALPEDGPGDGPGDGVPAWPAMHGHRMRVWLAEPADASRGPRCGSAHQSLRWAPWDELGSLPWLEADLPILTAIRSAALPARGCRA